MASIRRSARNEFTKASCGHRVVFYCPPGNIGIVGRRNMVEAQSKPCPECAKKDAEVVA